MKILLTMCFAIVMLSPIAFAQQYPQPMLLPGQSQISGGLGISWINGTPYYMIGVMPDLSFGKIGVGLDLTLHISTTDGTIQKVDWSNGAYRKIIRYVSWGQRHDPVYARVGQLDMATIGHGFIVYDYNNSASYDDRTIGAELNLDFTKFGFETMYGDFQTPGLMGGRAYVRPLKFTQLASVPIIGGFELGATYVTDQNPYSGVVNASYNQITQRDSVITNKGKIAEFGFDAGLPLLRIPFVDVDLYYDYAKIVNFGSGSAVGLLADFNGLELAKVSLKVERQFIGDKFIPEYFNQFYELDRYTPNAKPFISKAQMLDSMKASSGWYGQIMVAILQNFQIVGGYRGIADDPQGGLLHLETRFPSVVPMIAFSAGYDRRGVQNFGDVFKLDNRSLLYTFFGYKPYPFMTVGFNYYWTFIPENGTYSIQRRVEPRVMFNFSF